MTELARSLLCYILLLNPTEKRRFVASSPQYQGQQYSIAAGPCHRLWRAQTVQAKSFRLMEELRSNCWPHFRWNAFTWPSHTKSQLSIHQNHVPHLPSPKNNSQRKAYAAKQPSSEGADARTFSGPQQVVFRFHHYNRPAKAKT